LEGELAFSFATTGRVDVLNVWERGGDRWREGSSSLGGRGNGSARGGRRGRGPKRTDEYERGAIVSRYETR
jgi:hypothetical protein